MAHKLYDGYGITELRGWARKLNVRGRSKMSGDTLVTACRRANDEQLAVREQAALAAGTVLGARFAMQCGCVIEATSEPINHSIPQSADRLFVRGQYVSLCDACKKNTPAGLDYLNRAARGEMYGEPYRFFLWSLTRVEPSHMDINGTPVEVDSRVEGLGQERNGALGTVVSLHDPGYVGVEWDSDQGEQFDVRTELLLVVTA